MAESSKLSETEIDDWTTLIRILFEDASVGHVALAKQSSWSDTNTGEPSTRLYLDNYSKRDLDIITQVIDYNFKGVSLIADERYDNGGHYIKITKSSFAGRRKIGSLAALNPWKTIVFLLLCLAMAFVLAAFAKTLLV
jgi:hypothetical protein